MKVDIFLSNRSRWAWRLRDDDNDVILTCHIDHATYDGALTGASKVIREIKKEKITATKKPRDEEQSRVAKMRPNKMRAMVYNREYGEWWEEDVYLIDKDQNAFEVKDVLL